MVQPPSRALLYKLSTGLAAAAALLVPLGLLAAPTSGTVAAIGPPGRDMTAVVARAGGSILRTGGWANIVVATAGPSDLVARLYASGAWLVVDARFARGCAQLPVL